MNDRRHIAEQSSRAELDSERTDEALIQYRLLDYVATVLADASVGRRRRTSGLPALGAHAFCAMLACCTVLARSASAHEQQVLIGLTVTGPMSCEDRDALEREVKRRAEYVSFGSRENAPVTVDVNIGERNDGLGATIFIQRSGQMPATRVITAGNCQELLEGAALVIAVVLQRPRLLPGSPSPQAPEPSLTDPVEGSSQRPSPTATPEPPRAPYSRDADLPAPPNPSTTATAAGNHSGKLHVGGGAAAIISAGIGPGLMPGMEAFLSIGVDFEPAFPELRFGVRSVGRSNIAVDDATASFRLTSAVASFCPVAVKLDEVLSLRPYAVASYGDFRASGDNIENARSERHPFAGAGVGLSLEAALLPSLSLEVNLSSEVALTKSRFHLNDETFHETSPVAGYGGFGVVLRL